MLGAWLVAGLGNPGDRYARTRHNAGAMVAEHLCERLGVRLRKVRFISVLAAEARHGEVPLLLVVPATFMNVSGGPVASFAKKRDVPVDRIVACHDDIDLPFGAIRIKRGGGTAGHHGLDSLVRALRSRDFFRVRLGVGRPPGRQDPAEFVLEPFSRREHEDVQVMVETAVDSVLSLVDNGLSVTQDRFNQGGPGTGR